MSTLSCAESSILLICNTGTLSDDVFPEKEKMKNILKSVKNKISKISTPEPNSSLFPVPIYFRW